MFTIAVGVKRKLWISCIARYLLSSLLMALDPVALWPMIEKSFIEGNDLVSVERIQFEQMIPGDDRKSVVHTLIREGKKTRCPGRRIPTKWKLWIQRLNLSDEFGTAVGAVIEQDNCPVLEVVYPVAW